MQTGNLDQQIILQQPTITNDGGEVVQSWANIATVFAYITSPRGNEAFQASRVNAAETLRIKIRFRADVATNWRLSWGGVFYYVQAVDRTQRRDGYLWLTAQAKGVA